MLVVGRDGAHPEPSIIRTHPLIQVVQHSMPNVQSFGTNLISHSLACMFTCMIMMCRLNCSLMRPGQLTWANRLNMSCR